VRAKEDVRPRCSNGVSVFYREAGSCDAPTLLLLHGFPSSSRMYNGLIRHLAARFYIIAPDYPGFGYSDAPPPEKFSYTFDHLTTMIGKFIEQRGVDRYSLFIQDYGGPVGLRLAMRHPTRTQALVIQNAVAHEEGLGPLWGTRRAFWADWAANVEKIRANFLSFDAARQRHVGTSPHPERYDPDAWTDEFSFLNRAGQARIQEDLLFDYRKNVASYPAWQAYLKEWQPPLLVLWGKYEPSFAVAGAHAYQRDVPSAQVHILNAGHFALDEAGAQIARLTLDFLSTHLLDSNGNSKMAG